MKQLLLSLITLLPLGILAQQGDADTVPVKTEHIDIELTGKEKKTFHYTCDSPADFPGGRDSLNAFISRSIHYPQRAVDEQITGKCFVKFVITAEGKVSDPFVERGIPGCPECDAAVLKVFTLMPAWVPALLVKKPVDSYATVPVRFTPPSVK